MAASSPCGPAGQAWPGPGPGSARAGPGSARAGLGSGWLFGFRLDFGWLSGFRLRLDFALILVWLDLDLA